MDKPSFVKLTCHYVVSCISFTCFYIQQPVTVSVRMRMLCQTYYFIVHLIDVLRRKAIVRFLLLVYLVHWVSNSVFCLFLEVIVYTGLFTVCTLDLRAACDTTDHSILLNKLQLSFGFSSTVHQWLHSYLISWTQIVPFGF